MSAFVDVTASPVIVLLRRYELQQVTELNDDDGEALEGQVGHDELTIQLRAELAPMRAYQTLWHETLHCIANQMHIKFRNDEELDRLATGIVMVLRDNAWMRHPPTT